jgi:hypothetical protein
MAENTPNVEVKQYLDYTGLQRLWEKISDTYIRKAGIVDNLAKTGVLISDEKDTFIRKEILDDQIALLEDAISKIENAQSSLADGVTIVQDAETKLISTNIILDHNTETHEISLITRDTGEGSTVVSTIDYSDFYAEAIKDGMLKNVSLVYVSSDDPTADGHSEGTYLKFEWNTDAGISVTYLCVDDLVPIYSNGNYIKIEHSYDVDGKSDDVKISLDKETLVTDLNADDAFGVSALRFYVEGIEEKVSKLEIVVEKINKSWEEFETTLTGILERIGDIEQDIVEINEFLEKVPYVPITSAEIEDLDNLL